MEWIAVPPGEAERLRALDGDAFVQWLIGPDPVRVDVDKTWHGVHAVLTGERWDAPGPLGWAVLGGDEFADDLGYGPPRLLAPDQVVQVADALDELGAEGFTAAVDPERLVALEIYPTDIWTTAAEWLVESFEVIRRFYRDAADAGHAVVILLS